ncbi:MAG: hypothetical protein ACAH06_02115, partial [Methylophilaceae bacterium]
MLDQAGKHCLPFDNFLFWRGLQGIRTDNRTLFKLDLNSQNSEDSGFLFSKSSRIRLRIIAMRAPGENLDDQSHPR